MAFVKETGNTNFLQKRDMDIPDHVLMQAVASGDRSAYQMLMQRHLDFCVGFAERMLQNRMDAEDVTQAVWVKLWQKPDAFVPDALFTTWLYRVMHNACIDATRRRRRVGDTDQVDGIEDPAPSPPDTMQYKQAASAVRSALAALPENQRAAVILSYYNDVPNKEAAAVLQMNVNAFQQLLYRARQRLRRSLEEKNDG